MEHQPIPPDVLSKGRLDFGIGASWLEAGVDRLCVKPWRRTSGAMDAIAEFARQYIGL